MSRCAETGCGRVVHARGLCGAHYQAHSRHGDLPGIAKDERSCGEGTPYGCGRYVYGETHIVLGIAPPHRGHNGMREFHARTCCPCPSCLNLIEVVPNAFSRGLAREQAARVARAAS